MHRKTLFTLALVIGLGVGACSRSSRQDEVTPNPASGAPTETSPVGGTGAIEATSNDITITTTIRQTIAGEDSLSADARQVVITTSDGVVTLRGTVLAQWEKDYIAGIANNMIGVKHVDDRIVVKVAVP